MRSRIIACLQRLGFIVDEREENFELQEYLEDSVSFISFIVELESEFDIEIPDEYLMPDSMKTYKDVCAAIEAAQCSN